MKRFCTLILIFALLCGTGLADRSLKQAMKHVYPSLVRINVVVEAASGGRMQKRQGAGSGAVISEDGYIITNHHVAGNATRITCRMPDGEEIEADLVGTDALADIAVVKLRMDQWKKKTPPPVARFGNSDKVKVGDEVFALGSPAALSQSVTRGIVSNTAMILPNLGLPIKFKLDGEDTGSLVRWIGHDAVIFGGNSGGPLVNTKGEIIGINEVGIGSLGGAIPSNLAKSVAEQLIRTGTVDRSWIGLEFQPRLKNGSAKKGVLVSGVIADSPAATAGLQSGDIVTAYDGVGVDCRIDEDLPVFNRLILSTPIGKTVAIEALRDGKKKTFELTTIPRDLARGKDIEVKQWGITARDLTSLSAMELERPDTNGVYVSSVRAGGAGNQAKFPLKDEDIIVAVDRQPVNTVAELRKVTKTRTQGQDEAIPTLVELERDGHQYLTVVDLGPEPDPDKPLLSKKAWFPAATQVLTEDLTEALKLGQQKGLRITRIYEGRSAEKAGFQVGDILTKLDGERIDVSQPEDEDIFEEMIRKYKIGSEVTFEVVRDGQTQEIAVTLEAPFKSSNELKSYEDEYFEMTVRELAFQDRVDKKLDEDVRGVLVKRVERSGWASLGGLLMDDILLSINGQPVSDVDTLKTLLTEARQNQSNRLIFFVKRGIHTRYLELEPDWNGSAQSDSAQ